jgi:hypothetical protein
MIFPLPDSRRYTHLEVGRNKAIQARSARWRFRHSMLRSAGNARPCYRRAGLFRPTFIVPTLERGNDKNLPLNGEKTWPLPH